MELTSTGVVVVVISVAFMSLEIVVVSVTLSIVVCALPVAGQQVNNMKTHAID